MLNKLGNITVVVTWLILALVDSFTLPVSTSSHMELPLSIFHQLVILVEWADKYSCSVGHQINFEFLNKFIDLNYHTEFK